MEKEKDLQTSERKKNRAEDKSTVEYLFQEVAELFFRGPNWKKKNNLFKE